MPNRTTIYWLSVAFLSVIVVWLSWRGALVTLFGVRSTAECVRVDERHSKRQTFKYCLLRFKDSKGNEHHVSLRDDNLKPGDIASIIYNENDPQIAYFDSLLDIWILPVILTFMIVVGCCFSRRF
jgi:hypothetical protein